MADTSLTHQNKTPQQAVGIYCIAVKELITGTMPDRAYTIAKKFAQLHSQQIFKWFQIIDKNTVQQNIRVDENIGWVKIAFVYSFYYLKKGFQYKDALIDIISRGGDTDTNACIVGGLLGAACGLNNLPQDVKKQFFSDDKIKEMQSVERLKEHQLIAQKQVYQLVESLLNIKPKQLNIKYNP